MWKFIRILVSGFIAIETLIRNIANGVSLKKIAMPEIVTSEHTQYVDPFTGTGGTP